MSREFKLEEYGLVEEAKKLREEGFGWIETASILTRAHPEVEGGLSHMAVKRGVLKAGTNEIQEQMEQGLNPVDEFSKELKLKINESTEELQSLKDKAEIILKEAMGGDSINDKTKALREVRETLRDIVKNQVTLQQYFNQKVDNLDREAFKQTEQVKILLVKWITVIEKELCPECKNESIPKIISFMESEGEK